MKVSTFESLYRDERIAFIRDYGIPVDQLYDKGFVYYLYYTMGFFVELALECTPGGTHIKAIDAFDGGSPLEKYLDKIELSCLLKD
jgi:hypothetical protein